MTTEELKALDDKRREREDELVLLLLLLLGWGVNRLADDDRAGVAALVQPSGNGQPGTRTPTNVSPAGNRPAPGILAALRKLLTRFGIPEIAGSMADAHIDGFAVFGAKVTPPNRDTLIRQYSATAREMTDAMVESIKGHLITAEGDLAEALRLAGYTKSNSRNLEVGAERNVIAASNAGLVGGAVSILGKKGVTRLMHVSVVDERTTRWCLPRNGVNLPIGHPYWQKNWPSLHAGCRSTIVPLKASSVVRVTPDALLTGLLPPEKGYGEAPESIMAILRSAAA